MGVALGFELGGEGVEDGGQVTEGQLLFAIDPTDAEVALSAGTVSQRVLIMLIEKRSPRRQFALHLLRVRRECPKQP